MPKKKIDEQKLLEILKNVYLAGWKQNKAKTITDPFQLSPEQALELIKEML